MKIDRNYVVDMKQKVDKRQIIKLGSYSSWLNMNLPKNVDLDFKIGDKIKVIYSNEDNLEKQKGIWMFKKSVEKRRRTNFLMGERLPSDSLYEMIMDSNEIREYSCQALINIDQEQYRILEKGEEDYSFRLDFVR